MAESAPRPGVASPCRRMCTLDEHDVCMGCGRTLADITGWWGMDDEARQRVLVEAEARVEQYRLRFPWAYR